MFGLGVTELLLIVAMLVLIFGARKIPQIARGLGEGIRNFKGEISPPDPPTDDRSDSGDDRPS
jgi:sec-independent protein translocase protein TatA